GNVRDLDMTAVRKLASYLHADPAGLDNSQPSQTVIEQLLDRYAMAATKSILTKAKQFAETHDKKLLVVLFDPSRVLRPLDEGKARYDQTIIDFLREQQFRYFDMNLVHVEDYKNF